MDASTGRVEGEVTETIGAIVSQEALLHIAFREIDSGAVGVQSNPAALCDYVGPGLGDPTLPTSLTRLQGPDVPRGALRPNSSGSGA